MLHVLMRWHVPGHRALRSLVHGGVLKESSLKIAQVVGPMLSARDICLWSPQVRHLSTSDLAPGLAQRVCSLGNDGGKQLGLVRHELEVSGQAVRRSPRSRDTRHYPGGCSLGRNVAEPLRVGWLRWFSPFLFLIRVSIWTLITVKELHTVRAELGQLGSTGFKKASTSLLIPDQLPQGRPSPGLAFT